MKDEDEGWPSHPPVYFDEWTWRRHLSPVPVHSGLRHIVIPLQIETASLSVLLQAISTFLTMFSTVIYL